AALEGHEGVVKLLLGREDVDPNRPDVDDRTPLRCAAIEGHQGAVKLLLERGDVDPNRADKYGQTPLWWAAINGHEGVVKLLLGREDIDPNRPDVNDRTPLGIGSRHFGIEVILPSASSRGPHLCLNRGNLVFFFFQGGGWLYLGVSTKIVKHDLCLHRDLCWVSGNSLLIF
ncbi:ankyrin repeat-containing domain protein, partial [Tuber borchii]